MQWKYVGILFAVASAPLSAHDFWIQPQRFQVAAGGSLPVTFQVGHGSNRERWGLGADRIVLLEDVFAGRRVSRRGDVRSGGPADLVARFDGDGLHVLAMQTNYAVSNLPAVRFNDYAKEEGLVPAIAARRRTGTTNTPGKERYSRRAKALIQVGANSAANQALATRPIGLKLEIVPERNPYALPATRLMPVHVLYRGKRLANALVKLTDLRNDARPLSVAVTDRSGRAVFRIPPAGDYLLNVVWTEPVRGNAQVDFDTTFSSLTFGYPRRP